MLDKAIAITAAAFEGKFDKSGKPYILHCLEVMRRVKHLPVDVQCAAVMHDLVEDTSWTFEMLKDEGFGEHVIRLIFLLTHKPYESYKEYIERISYWQDAIEIKLQDLRHNSDITRLKGVTEKDIARMKKYHESYLYLMEAKKKHG